MLNTHRHVLAVGFEDSILVRLKLFPDFVQGSRALWRADELGSLECCLGGFGDTFCAHRHGFGIRLARTVVGSAEDRLDHRSYRISVIFKIKLEELLQIANGATALQVSTWLR